MIAGVVAAAALASVAAALVVPPRPQPSPQPSPQQSAQPSPQQSPQQSPAPQAPSPPPPARAEGLVRYRLLLSCGAGLGATLIVGGAVGLGVGPVVAVTVWQLLARMESPADRRHREQLAATLPHVVDLVASSLTAGSAPTTAVQLAARAVDEPMRRELLLVTSRLDLGGDPVRVWKDVGLHPQLGALGRTLARAIESGAPVSEAMYRLGEDLRRNARADIENRARAVGVKAAAPLGLCLLPAFILTGIVPLVVGSVGTVLRF